MNTEQIEHYQGWEEIFPDQETADKHFEYLLDGFRREYSDQDESTPVDLPSGVKLTIFELVEDKSITIHRTEDGDVGISILSPGKETHTIKITADVGHKNHSWDYERIRAMREKLQDHSETTTDMFRADDLRQLAFYLDGKPATEGWEEIFSYSDRKPIRIGYLIFPEDSLIQAEKEVEQL